MANPIQVTINSSGVTPCNITLYKSNPGDSRPNSVQWTNSSGSSVAWNCSTAATYLATSAPPNNSNPAQPNITISAGQTLTLWVKDNAAIGNGVNQQYSLSIGGNALSCITGEPPDLSIEP
jgi:hypothetical protein